MISHECGQLNNVVGNFEKLLQICTKINVFKFDFSKNFPQTPPRFFSDFAFSSGFTYSTHGASEIQDGGTI